MYSFRVVLTESSTLCIESRLFPRLEEKIATGLLIFLCFRRLRRLAMRLAIIFSRTSESLLYLESLGLSSCLFLEVIKPKCQPHPFAKNTLTGYRDDFSDISDIIPLTAWLKHQILDGRERRVKTSSNLLISNPVNRKSCGPSCSYILDLVHSFEHINISTVRTRQTLAPTTIDLM